MRGDITDIKRALASQALSVCQDLLPAGRVKSGEFEVGSVAGEEGKSLRIRLSGPKAGVWSDFSTGQGGDLIDLWCQVRDQKLVDALDDIRSWLGIEKPSFVRPVKREWTRPEKPAVVRPRDKVRDYLTEDRNLPEAILTRYKVADQEGAICFPFLRDGELIMYKVRDPVDGAKPKPVVADCEKILFGWQAIDPNARTIVITEGEIDALSMAAYSFDALSVPFGGGGGNKQDWIESEYDYLARFETIYLALDNDQAGEEAVEEIAKRLGRHRCKVVTLPHKDANECLVNGVPQSEIEAAVQAAAPLDPDQLSRVADYTDRVVELFYPPDGAPPGHVLPYHVFGRKVVFSAGEVTVWTGSTGSGKSQLISDCMVNWSHEGARVVVASLEMAPAQTLKRMVKQISGIGGEARPTEAHIINCLNWLDPSLLIYNRVGKDTVTNMLEAFDYCAAAYGSDTFVIDSLMRCGIAQDDYNAQEAAMFEIVDFAISRNVHIHLVAHTRKAGRDDKGPPDFESVKGTMEITANAFNVIAVWRDRDWEKLREEVEEDGKEPTEAQQAYLAAGGVVVFVSKQRNGDYTGSKRLHFDLDCYQYYSNQGEKNRSVSIDAAA